MSRRTLTKKLALFALILFADWILVLWITGG